MPEYSFEADDQKLIIGKCSCFFIRVVRALALTRALFSPQVNRPRRKRWTGEMAWMCRRRSRREGGVQLAFRVDIRLCAVARGVRAEDGANAGEPTGQNGARPSHRDLRKAVPREWVDAGEAHRLCGAWAGRDGHAEAFMVVWRAARL